MEAYRIYERLGPQRSTEKVRQQTGHRSSRLIERWSSAHDWVRRAAAYDAAEAAREEAEAAEQRKKARQQRLQVARGARSKGVEALTQLTAAELARLPSALVRLLEYADSTERKDLGEPDQRVEVAGHDGGAITVRVIYDDGSGPDPS
jgi:hypothetical protein